MMQVPTWWLILLAGVTYTIVQYHLWHSIRVVWQGKPCGDADKQADAFYKVHHAITSMYATDRVAAKESTKMLPASGTTMFLFVTYQDNDLNRKRIAEMFSLFKTNFMVVWGNPVQPVCPFQELKDAGLCLDEYQVSKTHRLSHMCCAQEMAFMWAMENRGHSFDNVWIMEDDVYITDTLELEKLISLDSPVDLLHQAPGDFHPWDDQWVYANEVRHDTKGLFNTSDMKTGIFNLFRMSTDFLAALEEVYNDLGNEWFFFEALLPSVVVSSRFNLTHASWLQQLHDTNNSTYVMTVKPRCITHVEKPGIYHPVKYKDGNFLSCPEHKLAPNITKGSPYKNQVSILQSPADIKQHQPLVHGCVGPLGGSTNWNAIAGWVKYHKERWGLTHADIFVLEEALHDAHDSFDAVGLDTSAVTLNFTLYSPTTTNGEAWLANECRANAIMGKGDFLIEFDLDRFLVSDSFVSFQDIFISTNYPDAIVFPTYTNNYGICNSNAMTFGSATFVDHLFPSFDLEPKPCRVWPPTPRCNMSDGVTRHFMYGNDHGKGSHLIHFTNEVSNENAAAGLHMDLSTKGCLSIKNCTHIGEDGECTDIIDIAFFEQQVTSINTILSELDLTRNVGEIKRHAVCYAKRYPSLLDGFCQGDESKCHYSGLHDHYVKHGSANGLLWECNPEVYKEMIDSDEIKHHAVCYAKRYPDLLDGFCNGEVSKCRYSGLYDHYVNVGSAMNLIWECDRELTDEEKRHAVCYAQRYPDLFDGFCHGDVNNCNYGDLYNHYANEGLAMNLIWECDHEFTVKEKRHAICYARRYPHLLDRFCSGDVWKCSYSDLHNHYVKHGRAEKLDYGCIVH